MQHLPVPTLDIFPAHPDIATATRDGLVFDDILLSPRDIAGVAASQTQPCSLPEGTRNSGSGNKFITGDDTARFLRNVAARVVHLNPREKTHQDILELFSAHTR